MNTAFYPKLASEGIKKNKKTYFPYILTCVLSVAMFYIMAYLCDAKIIDEIPKAESLKTILGLGVWVIAVFSVVFLFYTNSFLIKNRKKEFGLYNILGMDKKGIGKILLFEGGFLFAFSFVSGTVCGIAFSKLFELSLIKLIGENAKFTFSLSLSAIIKTFVLFLGIFLLIVLNSIRQIRSSSALNLTKSGNLGEKPPKANILLGILGFVILGGAYYIAVSIESPIDAAIWFLVAVIMVIIGSYLVFISGSVMLCRLLTKNKRYYYKKNHFVSVSSMTFRMKRNGAGLASICILLTMVLVMLSSTGCLFIGSKDSLNNRYPRDIMFNCSTSYRNVLSEEKTGKMRSDFDTAVKKYNTKNNGWDYFEIYVSGLLKDNGKIVIDSENETVYSFKDIVTLHFISLEDYNKMMGKNEKLKSGEALIFATHKGKIKKHYDISGLKIKTVKKLKKLKINGSSNVAVNPNLFVIVNNLRDVTNILAIKDKNAEDPLISYNYEYAFDTVKDLKTQEKITKELAKTARKTLGYGNNVRLTVQSAEQEKNDFFGTFGGFFFLAVMLSIMFLVAAVIIIYYKQITEGFEDADRFLIMQKIGMTEKDIKKSVNSQMLTVFFLPIVFAVMHTAFAFPLIKKILILFGITNTALLIFTTLATALVFSLFYAVVYKITSNAYLKIVSGKNS